MNANKWPLYINSKKRCRLKNLLAEFIDLLMMTYHNLTYFDIVVFLYLWASVYIVIVYSVLCCFKGIPIIVDNSPINKICCLGYI